MKPRQIITVLLTISSMSFMTFGQTSDTWRNYVDSASEIWFQAPASVLVDRDADLDAVTVHAFFDGVKFSISKQKTNIEPLKYVKNLGLPFGLKGSKVQDYKYDSIYVRREDETMGSDLLVTIHVGSKKSYFLMKLTAAKDNAAMTRFLETVRFSGSRLAVNSNGQDRPVATEPIAFDTLATSPEVRAAISRNSTGGAAGTFGNVRNWLPLELDKLTSEVILLRKPLPSYTEDARMRGIQGTIFVNVQFLASGEVGNITIDDRADRGLGKNVITAVRKIKFIPAQANGKAIDVTRTLFYKFGIY